MHEALARVFMYAIHFFVNFERFLLGTPWLILFLVLINVDISQIALLNLEKYSGVFWVTSKISQTTNESSELMSQRNSALISSDSYPGLNGLTFFSANSENMKNIRAYQLWFSMNQRCSELKNSALFHSKSALFRSYSASIFLSLKHLVFSAEKRWFTSNQLWYLHM